MTRVGFHYKFGKHVHANFDGTVELGHVVRGAYDVSGASGPEQKYGVLPPGSNEPRPLAYTKIDPEDLPGGFFTD